jgi:hypothetical protein
MDPLLVIIILALAATSVTLLIGLMSMSGGGAADKVLSTPLMWARVGLQALTLILLIVAVLLKGG